MLSKIFIFALFACSLALATPVCQETNLNSLDNLLQLSKPEDWFKNLGNIVNKVGNDLAQPFNAFESVTSLGLKVFHAGQDKIKKLQILALEKTIQNLNKLFVFLNEQLATLQDQLNNDARLNAAKVVNHGIKKADQFNEVVDNMYTANIIAQSGNSALKMLPDMSIEVSGNDDFSKAVKVALGNGPKSLENTIQNVVGLENGEKNINGNGDKTFGNTLEGCANPRSKIVEDNVNPAKQVINVELTCTGHIIGDSFNVGAKIFHGKVDGTKNIIEGAVNIEAKIVTDSVDGATNIIGNGCKDIQNTVVGDVNLETKIVNSSVDKAKNIITDGVKTAKIIVDHGVDLGVKVLEDSVNNAKNMMVKNINILAGNIKDGVNFGAKLVTGNVDEAKNTTGDGVKQVKQNTESGKWFTNPFRSVRK